MRVVVVGPIMSDGHEALIRTVVNSMPYGNQCSDFTQNSDGSVEFRWRTAKLRCDESGYCMSLDGAALVGDDISILATKIIQTALGQGTTAWAAVTPPAEPSHIPGTP